MCYETNLSGRPCYPKRLILFAVALVPQGYDAWV